MDMSAESFESRIKNARASSAHAETATHEVSDKEVYSAVYQAVSFDLDQSTMNACLRYSVSQGFEVASLESANCLLQSDHVYAPRWDFPGFDQLAGEEPAALYGKQITYDAGHVLSEPYEGWESFGEVEALDNNVILDANGYIDIDACTVDFDLYSKDELIEFAQERGTLDIELPAGKGGIER